ncbi:SET domain-containing protein 9 [Pseudolycoriella hygida]|uniref:SET domain-containing protein 9 n=1 Tax=Pseudolycoriella hygida TaxID=35572 RepID=A0A9Q0S3D3_9DIPT|nr:SET domain-containing protein 9 [Pseudolycoriella hygida]
MVRPLKNLWKNYKYRFVPWISLNIIRDERKRQRLLKLGEKTTNEAIKQNQSVRIDHIMKDGVLLSSREIRSTLTEYCGKLSYQKHPKYTVEDIHKKNASIFFEHFGFLLGRKKSHIVPEGLGVFVIDGTVNAGSIVGLYPGTVYMPNEPLFFPSLGNTFIFRCSDNVHVDGNDRWISKSIFRSCAVRDQFNFDVPCCDSTWMTQYPQNLLNIGQYVNNRSTSCDNNVVYQECNIFLTDANHLRPKDVTEDECFPVKFARFIPNVWSNPENNSRYSLRIIPLVALDDIATGSELLSSYFTVIHEKSAVDQTKSSERNNEKMME